jgi:hypothetical protein
MLVDGGNLPLGVASPKRSDEPGEQMGGCCSAAMVAPTSQQPSIRVSAKLFKMRPHAHPRREMAGRFRAGL